MSVDTLHKGDTDDDDNNDDNNNNNNNIETRLRKFVLNILRVVTIRRVKWSGMGHMSIC
jgi:hypothetical protein